MLPEISIRIIFPDGISKNSNKNKYYDCYNKQTFNKNLGINLL